MENKIERKGCFITFEGPEGCGKSTQSGKIYESLKADGYDAVYTKEPGDSVLGKRIREILLEKEEVSVNSIAELLLFEADRAQHLEEVIRPALSRGAVVICDRFNTATLAYQGYGLGMDMDMIKHIDDLVVNGTVPDLTVIIDVDVETGFRRVGSYRDTDKMEKRGAGFHDKVRNGYLEIAEKYCHMKVFDGKGNIDTVFTDIKRVVYELIQRD